MSQGEEATSSDEGSQSLRTMIEDAYDESESEVADAEPEVSRPKEPIDDAEETPVTRARDDKGRFVSSSRSTAPENKSQDPSPQTAGDQPQDTSTDDSPVVDVQAPFAWSGQAKELFNKLPPEFSGLKEEIAKRESDVRRFISKVSNDTAAIRQQFSQVEQFAGELAREHQVSTPQAVAQLVAAQRWMDRDPVSAISAIANTYGLDVQLIQRGSNGVTSAVSGQSNQLQTGDPYLQSLQQRLDQLQSIVGSWHEQQQQSYYGTLQGEVDGFAQSHEHYETVKPLLPALIQTVRQEMPEASRAAVLEEAYTRAIWAHPQAREAIRKQEEQARVNEAKDKASKAKRAGSSVTGSAGSGAPVKAKTLRGQIEQAFEQFA